MAALAALKTWQILSNQATTAATAIASNRDWIFSVKQALIGLASAPWAVRGSSSSVAAANVGDGVDRWASTANLVWANAGSAHSWIVLRQTGMGATYELLISCESASATGAIMHISYSLAGFTGGTTTAKPTATDETVLVNGAAWGTSGSNSIKWHLLAPTDGHCLRIFSYVGGTILNAFLLERPTDTTTGWTTPNFGYAAQIATAVAQTTVVGNGYVFRARINAVNASVVLLSLGTSSGNLGTETAWSNLANEVSTEWPVSALVMASNTVGARGVHGRLQDMWVGPVNTTNGDTYPSGTSRQYAQFGGFIVPWDGSVPTFS